MPTIEEPQLQPGMGAMLHDDGVTFRVWAPHADQVYVAGTFNDWNERQTPLKHEGGGYWAVNVTGAGIGDDYRYLIHNGDRTLSRIDPYAREVTNSIGNSVIHDPQFDWTDDGFQLAPWNELVIYEMHIGTFARSDDDQPGDFRSALQKLPYLRRLGINAIEIMPCAEFAGDWSWGYNPAHIYAIESAYGGPKGLKQFINAAHQEGLGVLLDVVYNHFGPSDLDLWQFDGWSENDKGGIYFYNDSRSSTPWGDTRPDYGREEVRQYIRDNAMMWLEEYHVDGLRYDMTLYMRSVDGRVMIPEGLSLAQWINHEVHTRFPGRIAIAEDMQNDPGLTLTEGLGGAGFDAQWDAGFVHPVKAAMRAVHDSERSVTSIRNALTHKYNIDVFERVVFSESHDEVANGKARVPSEVSPDDPVSWAAQKRSTLASALTLTAPGIPMLFQGQEFLTAGWFDDQVPFDWDAAAEHGGVVRLYRDLIALRRNLKGHTSGLTGQHIDVFYEDEDRKVIAYHRWAHGGPGDSTVVVANLSAGQQEIELAFPSDGRWELRFNSDWVGYSDEFDDMPASAVEAIPGAHGHRAAIAIAPYTAMIYSQDPDSDDGADSGD